MNPVTRITVAAIAFMWSLVAIFVPTNVHAQASNGPHLERYGEVELRALPPPAPGERGGRRLKEFQHPHPAAFRRHKDLANGQNVTPLGSVISSAAPSSFSTIAIDGAGFDGMSLADGGAIPPDTQVAVGPGHIFEAVNDHVRIWSRQTDPPSVIYDQDLGAFFKVDALTYVVSDPRVRYDVASGRWFVSLVTLGFDSQFQNIGSWRLAVSHTSDPTGSYTLYVTSFNGTFPDFPSLGFNDDKLALTGDAFTISNQTFLGSEFLVLSKADLIAGASAPAQQFFAPPQAVESIQVAESLSSTSTLYMAAVSTGNPTSTLQMWSINGVPGPGGGLAVTTAALTMHTSLVTPPDAAQAGSPTLIATNDARLLNVVYRDGSLWMAGNTGCVPAGDSVLRSCLHFAQISTATATVGQEITFGNLGEYYYYPAVEIDASDNLVTVFNRSSTGEFASIYASAHNVTDGAGTLQTPILVEMGLAAYDPSPNAPRWGDYSGAAADPFDGGASVWVAGQYTRSDGGSDWGTWIARVSAGATCMPPGTPTGVIATSGDAKVTISWTAAAGAVRYNVKRSLVSGGPYTTIATQVSSPPYTDTGLTNGTPFYYVVSAFNGCGESSGSLEVTATPQVGSSGLGITWRGPWVAATNYALNDAVSFGGSSYIAIGASTGAQPDVSPGSWSLLAQVGATGPAGPQGPTGNTGTTGAQGPQGPTGAVGATGATGLQGLAGAQGPAGPLGPAGPQGPAGSNGLNITWRGPWVAATSYAFNDAVSLGGSSYIATGASTGAEPDINASDWNLLAQVGATGPAGPQGQTGSTGMTGAQGVQGPAGPVGATGSIGPMGPLGPAGPANSQVWNTFLAGPLSTVFTAGRLTPDGNLSVTRIQVGLGTAPLGCSTNAVVQITDGTPAGTKTITLTAAANDSGPLAVNYAAGTPILVGLGIRAVGCGTKPQNANVLVQYKGR
jgi:hypothetical protein